MATLEITAPTNKTLTTKLFERGSDVLVETISLTELTNCKTVYIGTVSGYLVGFYKAVTFEDTTPLITNDIYFDGSEYVSVSDITISPTLEELYNRIVYTVPEGPIYPIPAPSSANVTRVYSYCYDVHGRPVAGVPITIKMMDVSTSANKGSYLSDAFTFTSDEYGVATAEIPRGISFRFRVKSGTNGAWIEFRGVDAETYQLPLLINK